MVNKVEQELLTATKLPARSNESVVKYRARIARTVDDFTEAAWKALSPAAQDWVNEAVAAMQEKRDVPDFPPGEVEEPVQKRDESTNAPESPTPTPNESESKAEPPQKPKTAPADKPATDRGRPLSSSVPFFRRLCIEHPTLRFDELLRKALDAGHQVSKGSATVVFYEVRATMRTLVEMGLLQGPEKVAAPEKAPAKPTPKARRTDAKPSPASPPIAAE